MVKSISLLKRKPGMSDKEFYNHYLEKHGPLAASVVPGMIKYVQNHPIKLLGFINEFDAITEIWFDSVESFEKWMAWRKTDEAKVLLDDEDRFLDMTKIVRYVVEEHLIK